MADTESSTTNTTTPAVSDNSSLEVALRTQVSDLLTQVTQLNSKLVSSYDRISDLEDELHVSSHQLRQHTIKISEMELEREKHRSMIEGGLLVEKAHVTQELTRLMLEANLSQSKGEEEKKGRERMEKELDELSAGLFEQANNMVKEARMEKAQEVERREKAEDQLASSEEAARSLQGKLGQLTTELELVQAGKAKTGLILPEMPAIRHLLSTTQPYTEFLLFIAHLRGLHPASPAPPSMSTLLTLPWMARLTIEDVDPTLRLDLAPSLNWLSRRTVLASIQNGGLTVETVTPAFFSEHVNAPTCGLCGHQIFEGHISTNREASSPWRIDRFKKTIGFPSDRLSIATTASSKYSSPPPTPPRVPSPPLRSNASVLSMASSMTSKAFIFRIPTQLTNQSSSNSHNPTQTYALCSSGTCLARLRATMALFVFIRNEVVGGVWREEIPELAMPELPARNPGRRNSQSKPTSSINGAHLSSPPPVPPRKRSLWGTMTNAWEKVAPASPTRHAPPIQKSATAPPMLVSPTPKVAALPPLPTVPDPVIPPPLPQRSNSRRKSTPMPPKGEQKPEEKPEDVLFDHDDHDRGHSEQNPVIQTEAKDNEKSSPEVSETLAPAPLPSPPPSEAPSDTNPTAESPAVEQETSAASQATPPPIPRRAAARRPAPGPPELSHEGDPDTPVAIPPTNEKNDLPTQKDEQASSEEQKTTANDEAKSPSSEEEEKKDLPSEDAQTPPSDKNETNNENEDSFVDAPEGDDAQSPPVPPTTTSGSSDAPTAIAQEKSDEQPAESAPEAIKSTDEEPSTSVPPTETLQITSSPSPQPPPDDDRAVTPTPASPLVSTKSVPTSPLLEEFDPPFSVKGGVDPGLYISSRTWEERTWKELVRLREEMWWARVGGVFS